MKITILSFSILMILSSCTPNESKTHKSLIIDSHNNNYHQSYNGFPRDPYNGQVFYYGGNKYVYNSLLSKWILDNNSNKKEDNYSSPNLYNKGNYTNTYNNSISTPSSSINTSKKSSSLGISNSSSKNNSSGSSITLSKKKLDSKNKSRSSYNSKKTSSKVKLRKRKR